jgi:hypothetical protein
MKVKTQPKAKAASGARVHADLRSQIEARAYHLWLADGRPHGNDLHYWLQAEREVVNALPSRQDAGQT